MKTDSELTNDVLVRLALNPLLDASGVMVSVQNGVVTLQGSLNSGCDRRVTERAVKLVPGVKGLVDRIKVDSPEPAAPTDAEVAAVATEAIRWLTTVPPESVSLAVRDGWVTLRGTVETQHQRDTLAEVLRDLPQVKGVNDLLELKG